MDKSALNSLLYFAGAMVGQVLFWVSRWANGEQWVMVNCRRTIAALIGNFTAIAAIIASGAADSLTSAAAVFSGITLGVAADSILNRGQRKEWTAEERQEKSK